MFPTASAPAGTTTTTAPAAPPAAKATLLADLDTGRVLAEDNDHTPLPPASLTKILTAMVAGDWLTPDAQIPVSDRAANVAPDKLGMKAGQTWPYDIAMHALLISSSNDAAYALAEKTAGSVEAFASLMQRAAGQIGMRDHPVLRDPAGLDGSQGAGGGNLMSAWDVAVSARDLMANPYLASIVAVKSFRFTGPDGIVYVLSSHNRAFLNSYAGAIGVKTGYTVPAGVCVAAEATRDGRHMLAVVMSGVSPDRTAEMLLDQGFATPAGAEPITAPMLPAVAEPEPAYAPPVADPPAALGARPLAASAASADSAGKRSTSSVWPALLAGAGLAALAAGAIWLVVRGRRRVRNL